MFKKSSPLGVVHQVSELEDRLTYYARIWDGTKIKSWLPKVDFSKITSFLLFALDDFINILSKVEIPGPDKKATVLDAIDRLYEYTVREALPIWARPFAGVIKSYIIYVLISVAIDWIVSKYKSTWRKETNQQGGESEEK